MKGINHKRYHFDHLSLNIIIAVDADTSPMSTTPVLLLNKFIYVIIVDYLPLGRLGNYVINL